MDDDVYTPSVISKPRDLPEPVLKALVPVDPSWSPTAAELARLHEELDLLGEEDS